MVFCSAVVRCSAIEFGEVQYGAVSMLRVRCDTVRCVSNL